MVHLDFPVHFPAHTGFPVLLIGRGRQGVDSAQIFAGRPPVGGRFRFGQAGDYRLGVLPSTQENRV